MNFEFIVDVDIKQEYLNSKPTGTARDNGFTLKMVDEHESTIGKSVYNFTIAERNELIAIFPNKSLGTILKNVSNIKNYIDFCIGKGIVNHYENRFATFTKDDAKPFVSKQAINNKYITLEELKLCIDSLTNYQDQLLIALPYYGVRGRPEKDGTLEEIINLQIRQGSKNHQENTLKLVRNNGEIRYIKIPDWLMELVIDTKNQEYYVSNNGEPIVGIKGEIKKSIINPIGDYVFRIPSRNKIDIFSPQIINSRIHRIQDWVGNQYLTISSLYMSGMITALKNIYEIKGELDFEDYVSVADQFDYGSGNPERYVINLKDQIELYIKEWEINA